MRRASTTGERERDWGSAPYRRARRRARGHGAAPVIGVLIGFAVIGAIIGTGYLVGRLGILGENAASVLGRLGFFVLTPCLLFTVLSNADVHEIFSGLLLVSAAAAVASATVYILVARLIWRRAVPETVIGALGSGYVNANNIGIPVASFVIGSAAYSAPVVLLQMLVFAPVALTILDVYHRGGGVSWRILVQPFRNPILIGSLAGVLVSVSGWQLPEAVLEPLHLIAGAAVPVLLIAFGISLHGRRPLAPGSSRRDIILASALKLVLMPTVAWAVGFLAFGLRGLDLFAVTVLAALPAAQNVFNYAQRYDRAVVMARDIVLVTTLLSLPALLVIAALLAPH